MLVQVTDAYRDGRVKDVPTLNKKNIQEVTARWVAAPCCMRAVGRSGSRHRTGTLTWPALSQSISN